MKQSSSDLEVAEFMVEQLREQKILYQQTIVDEIRSRFGESFVYDNANDNLAINPSVLKQFRNLTKDQVIWSRSERYWRYKQEHDPSGRISE